MKDIRGYEGLYAITEDGQVWSYRNKRFLKQRIMQNYYYVTLCVNGSRKDYRVHRLVAEAFIDNPDNKPQVNHIDENKLNNNIDNLEWVTCQENINHSTRTDRMKEQLKTSMSKAVYCVELDKTFIGATAASRELGIDNSSITKCCKGKLTKAGGYHWRYE